MSGSISQIMIDYLNDFVSSSMQLIVLTTFTLLCIRILHRTVFYPAYLTPLWALPTPPNRSWTRGSYTLAPVASHIARLRHWRATVMNNGLIRYYLSGNEERVLVTSVEALNDILVLKATHFVKPDVVRQRLSYIAGNGLLLAEGETHKIQRKSLMPAFSFRHIKNLYPIFWAKAVELADCLEKELNEVSISESSKSDVIEVKKWATRVTLDIIGLAGLGHDFDSLRSPNNALSRQYRQMRQDPSRLESSLEGVLSLFSTHAAMLMLQIPTRRMRRVKDASSHIRSMCSDILKDMRNKNDLDTVKQGNGNIAAVTLRSGVLTDSELVDQMMTLLAAGHGTTSHALQWAVYALCKQPEIQVRLRKEVRSRLGPITDRQSTVSAADIDGLPYLHAVCSETLRFYPSVPSTIREAWHDITVAGHRIPKGTHFTISPAVINVDPDLWGPDAGTFDPGRWMREGHTNSGGVRSHQGFLTFLQGPRSCLGSAFARAELACLVAVLVGRFHMELEDPDREEVLTKRGVGAAPADGVRVRMKVVEGW